MSGPKETLADLIEAVNQESLTHIYIQTSRGRIRLSAWDGIDNRYGDTFRATNVIVERSFHLHTAIRNAQHLLGHDLVPTPTSEESA